MEATFKVLSAIFVAVLLIYSSNGQVIVDIPRPQGVIISEGDVFMACFQFATPPASESTILNVQNNTPDISLLNENLEFIGGSSDSQCIDNIMVLEDNIYEGTFEALENLVFTFSSSSGGGISIDLGTGGTLVITDTSVLPVNLEESSYTVIEGGQISVCAVIDGSIVSPLMLTATLNVTLGTATGPDYVEPLNFIFDSNTQDQRVCVVFVTLNDTLFEGMEMLTLSLDGIPPLEVAPDTATVSIFDVDGDCGPPPEGTGTVSALSGQYTTTSGGVIISNDGAVASYSCVNPDAELNGTSNLVCTLGSGAAQWIPLEAPTCKDPPTMRSTTTDSEDPDTTTPDTETETTTTDMETETNTTETNTTETTSAGPSTTDDTTGTDPDTTTTATSPNNNDRDIGIGVGVGVGGAILILVAVLIIVAVIVHCKRGNRHSKYVLNYSTVYGSGTQGRSTGGKSGAQNEYFEAQERNKPADPESGNPKPAAQPEVADPEPAQPEVANPEPATDVGEAVDLM